VNTNTEHHATQLADELRFIAGGMRTEPAALHIAADLLLELTAEKNRLKDERDELRRLLMHMVKAWARWTPTRGCIRIEEQERALARFDELSANWWKG
jgi:hypothetical protein